MSVAETMAPASDDANRCIRHDWTREEVRALFALPFPELMFRAQAIHRLHFDPCAVQISTLLSIKTGGCPEDCGYCAQSVHADSGVKATKLMDVREVLQKAAQARDAGSQRFCMGAAWRNPKDRDMPAIVEIVQGVRAMGLETCMTLGMLTPRQAEQLAEAGLDLEETQQFEPRAGADPALTVKLWLGRDRRLLIADPAPPANAAKETV